MKQQLWILNSSLLAVFFVSLMVSYFLSVEPPRIRRIKKMVAQEVAEKKEASLARTSWEKIYKDDIFGTFVKQVTKPVKQSFVTPIPEPKAPAIPPPPEPPKQEFIAPLNLTIKGIIISADEAKSVAMIEDETKKEGLYHLGDKIKDAQVIKIARNRIVLLRANGQQETFFLRKDESEVDQQSPERWKYIARKVDDQTYEIDPDSFKQEIETLGNFIERVSLIGVAYQKGSPIGLRIGSLEKNDVGVALGLQQNDILISINNVDVTVANNRMQAYDAISKVKVGDTISLVLKRAGENLTQNYKLAKISKAKKKTFTGKEEKKKEPLKKSKSQQRAKMLRDFRKRHGSSQDKNAIARIRKRLLENLKKRLRNSRVR